MIIILSPSISQSLAISRLLKKSRPDIRRVAGLAANERLYGRHPYQEAITVDYKKLLDLKADVIIPTGALSTQAMAQSFPEMTIGEIPFSPENMRTGDKEWMLNRADQLSVPIPVTWASLGDVPADSGPVFFKPRQEGRGGLRSVASSKTSIPTQARGENYIYQEYIESQGTYGFAFIARNGEIICSQQYLEKHSYPRDGGSASIIEVFEDKRIDSYSRRLIRHLGYSGWGLVEFKYCPRRKDYILMEINAKFWASLEFTLRQQPCFAKLLLGIDMPRSSHKGLVWPGRLLASGLDIFARSAMDLANYPWVCEPGDMRMVASAWLPDSIKNNIRKLFG